MVRHSNVFSKKGFWIKKRHFTFTVFLTWCALHMRSISCLWRNLATTSDPKVKETPRSFSPQPITSLSGSAHSKSQSKPWSGTSVGLITRLICSIDCKSGERPGTKCHQTLLWPDPSLPYCHANINALLSIVRFLDNPNLKLDDIITSTPQGFHKEEVFLHVIA